MSSVSFLRALVCGWLAASFPTPLACPRLCLQERQLESGILFNTSLLPNQTWIHKPMQNKTPTAVLTAVTMLYTTSPGLTYNWRFESLDFMSLFFIEFFIIFIL